MKQGILHRTKSRLGAIYKAAVGTTVLPDGFIRDSYPGAWQNGAAPVPVAFGEVTQYGAVYACIARISGDIAKLAWKLKTEEDGVLLDAPPASPFWGVLRKPNDFQTRVQFLLSWITAKLMYGNAYGIKQRDKRGVVTQILWVDSRKATPLVTETGDVYYRFGSDPMKQKPNDLTLPAREVIHDRGLTLWHPLVGVSPIYACGTSVTQGLRIQSNSKKFFENMSRPSGLLTAPGTIETETADRIKRDWEQNYSQLNLGRLAVLGDGLKYEPMTISPEDAQLIAQLSWTVEDVARCFLVPLYKINAGPIPTAGNVEALELQYYSGCLQILIEAFEAVMTEGLELPTGMSIEMDLDGLLRMDGMSTMDYLTKGVSGGVLQPNEARSKLNLTPTEGGDTVYLQQQNYSLAALAERDKTAFSTPPPSPQGPPGPAPDATPEDSPPGEDPEDNPPSDPNRALTPEEREAICHVFDVMMGVEHA